MPNSVGEKGVILDIYHGVLYDYKVLMKDGTDGKFRECELDLLEEEECEIDFVRRDDVDK